jgi:lycopene cyclase domain-containing protein
MSYAGLALVFLSAAVVTAAVVSRLVVLPRRWWWATAIVAVVLVTLTAVFDSVMILADLFRYDTASLTGVRVWLTPVEDFAWPLTAVLVLPALWELLGRTSATRRLPREH